MIGNFNELTGVVSNNAPGLSKQFCMKIWGSSARREGRVAGSQHILMPIYSSEPTEMAHDNMYVACTKMEAEREMLGSHSPEIPQYTL